MPLNDKHIRILEVIDAGNISGESIADALGTSMQMLRYYLDTLSEDGYLKAAKVYDNSTREFLIVRAYLTDKGQSALAELRNPSQHSTVTIEPLRGSPAAIVPSSTGQINSSKLATSDQSTSHNSTQVFIEGLNDVIHSLDVLSQIIEELPSDRREIVSVYLSDLQNEIKIVYRRKPHRIKAYFLAVLGTTLPIIKQARSASTFIEHARNLSTKLEIPVKLPVL